MNGEMTAAHVVPRGDLIQHDHNDDNGTACVCGPAIEVIPGRGTVIVHHSIDGRERAE